MKKKVVSVFSSTKVHFNPIFIWLEGIDDVKIKRGYSLGSTRAKNVGKDLSKLRGGGGGMNWEIGIDIYTLICIK